MKNIKNTEIVNKTSEDKILSFKKGGIHIKKKNRGKFTSYCGGNVTAECIARGKHSSNPAIRKRATFAANARKWKHQEGGIMDADPDARYAKEWMVNWVKGRRGLLDKNIDQLKEEIPKNSVSTQYVNHNAMFNNQLNRAKNANIKFVPNLKSQYGRDVLGLTLDSWNLDKLEEAPNMVFHNRLANIPNISINESSDYSMGTIVHELTHGLGATPQEAAIAKYMKDKTYIANPKSNGDESEEFYKYLDEPAEIYSRRNEILHWYDKDPNYKYNKNDLDEMRRDLDDSNLNEGFLKRYDDDFLLYLMNDVAANSKWPNRTNKVQKGGSIRSLGSTQHIDYSKINPSRKKALNYVDSELQKSGYGYYPRLAILSSIQRESGGNPLAQNGRWQGLLQWDERRYRIGQQDSASELQRQTNHLLNELKRSGWNGNSKLQQQFIEANNLDEANNSFVDGFVRPGNREREKQIRRNIGLNGLVVKQNKYVPIDSSLPGITTKYQKGGSLIYGNESNGLVYTQMDAPEIPELTFEDKDRYPVRPVRTKAQVSEPVPVQTPVETGNQSTQTVQQPVQPVVQPTVTQPVQPTIQPKIETQVTTTSGKGKVYKSAEKQQFKTDMYNAYHSALVKKGLKEKDAAEFARRLTTQAILESNWGQSSLSKDFNFGGVKDFSGKGVSKDTKEFINGKMVTVKQPFRKFASVDDYVNYKINLVGNKWKVFQSTPDNYFTLIVSGKQKYATDPNYTAKLNNLHKQVWA